jgi:hypothetical protein
MVADAHHELPESKAKFPAFQRWQPNLKDREGNKVLIDKKSDMNHRHASNKIKKQYMTLWGKADECPLFRQKMEQQEDEQGNKIPYKRSKATKKLINTRGNRALSGHTLKTLASGAGAAISAQLVDDAKLLRLDLPEDGAVEDPKQPMLPTFTMGAGFAVEAAFVAYVQEIFKVAVDIKNAAGRHEKVTAKVCQAAANIVNRRLAASTGFVPSRISIRKTPIATKKRRAIRTAAVVADKEDANP